MGVYRDLRLASEHHGTFPFLERIFPGRGRLFMRLLKRVVSSCISVVFAATGLALVVATSAYGGDRPNADAVRHMKGRTIFSGEAPKVALSVRKGLRFIGTQKVNLHGNAEAEQYVFARSGSNRTVERFYLVQFEHFLPTNNLTYNYASMPTTQIDSLHFNYDVKSLPDIAVLLKGDPDSDGAAMESLLERQHLSLPLQTAVVRMFHLPSADHRSELMIIYGEALPQNTTVPVRKGGVQLDTELPGSAKIFLDHARQGLIVQTR